MANAQLRFGLIGWGYWGPKIAKNINRLPCATLACICDADEHRLTQVAMEYPTVSVSQSADALFASDAIDCVIIATPVKTHYKLARQALLNGKHVMVEKPLTSSVAEAEELVALAAREQLVLMVGHTFEYSPAVNALRAMVERGDLGRVFCVEAERLNLGIFREDIDVIWDLAPHDVSILNYVLGKQPTGVRASAHGHLRSAIPHNAPLDREYAVGASAHVQVSWMYPVKVRKVTLIAEDRMVIYDDTNADHPLHVYHKGADVGADPVIAYRNGEITHPELEKGEPLGLECLDFANAILNGSSPRASGAVGLAVVRILAAAKQSLDEGGRVVALHPGEMPTDALVGASNSVNPGIQR